MGRTAEFSELVEIGTCIKSRIFTWKYVFHSCKRHTKRKSLKLKMPYWFFQKTTALHYTTLNRVKNFRIHRIYHYRSQITAIITGEHRDTASNSQTRQMKETLETGNLPPEDANFTN